MTKFQQILTDLQAFFSPLINWIVDFVSLVTGFSTVFTEKFLLYTLGLIIILFFFQLIKYKMYKSVIKHIENLVEIYDKIFYIIAKKQYIRQQNGTKNNLQTKLLINIFDSNPLPTYLNSKNLIKNEIQKLEKEFGEQILSESNRSQIEKKHSHIKNKRMIIHGIRGIILVVIILYIYLLVK